ncbi:hypothetical protein [Planomonospora parontospora]|uniref:hypothetical protein n=1 Tax=Planomonospora parontospora TaxID=58119 RepID=UPI0016716AFE|nr:hypothetical protein [Planomonospora parontospora]GGL42459.1 hypothetical protein GCM10014719_49730 [Planomonospora parontospora subsp. antibiotica]GII18388.1 hypothetical protein Ppa05_51140 [Planomonospora parontospora subsp. antibiotica]
MNGHGGYTGSVLAYNLEEATRQELQRLRRDYPNWGFLVLSYVWVAVRGKNIVVVASTPRELRAALPPAPADPPVAYPLATTRPLAAVPGPAGVLPAQATRTGTWAVVGRSPAVTRLGRLLWSWCHRSSGRA